MIFFIFLAIHKICGQPNITFLCLYIWSGVDVCVCNKANECCCMLPRDALSQMTHTTSLCYVVCATLELEALVSLLEEFLIVTV